MQVPRVRKGEITAATNSEAEKQQSVVRSSVVRRPSVFRKLRCILTEAAILERTRRSRVKDGACSFKENKHKQSLESYGAHCLQPEGKVSGQEPNEIHSRQFLLHAQKTAAFVIS